MRNYNDKFTQMPLLLSLYVVQATHLVLLFTNKLLNKPKDIGNDVII